MLCSRQLDGKKEIHSPSEVEQIMSRTILAAIRPVAGQECLISAIVSLAQRHHLSIEGISIIDPAQLAPPETVPRGGEAFKIECDQKAIATGRQIADEVLNQLSKAAGKKDVECSVRIKDGIIREELSCAVQGADWLFCGGSPQANSSERSLLYSILKYSSRPVLVVPPSHVDVEGVLIAYDGSRQAAQALASFVTSGLWENRTIHLVAIENGFSQLAEHMKSAALFLHRHGISYELHIRQHSRDIGQDLLKEVRRLSVGIVVMGAFGKNSVHEFFLGSVTRTLLDALPVSLFLDH